MFLVNLALGDIAMSLLTMTAPLEATLTRQWPFGRGPICQLNAFCNSLLLCNTIFTHAAISVDRFFAVVKPMSKIMTKKKALLAILAVWVMSLVISLGPVLGWGQNEYNGTTIQCGFGFPRGIVESLYLIFLVTFAFFVPIVIMSYAYIRIYWVVRHHARRLSTSTFGNYQHAAIQQERKTVFTFFLALIAFIGCWTPFFVFVAFAVTVPSRAEIPHGLGIAAYWCGFLNSALNPFLIGLRSERFQEAFKRVLCWCFIPCRCTPKQQNVNKSSTDKTLCSDTNLNNRSMPQPTKSQSNGDIFGSYANQIASVTNPASKPDLTSSPVRNNEERSGRKGRQEYTIIYRNFIYLVEGKVWNEATV